MFFRRNFKFFALYQSTISFRLGSKHARDLSLNKHPGNSNYMAVFEVTSKSGKTIRLTNRIWFEKILREHAEFGQSPAEYLNEIKKVMEDPEYIVKGWTGELLALKWCEIAPSSPKHICVVYRELNGDGFVITAFFISRYGKLLKREMIWKKK